MFAQATTDVQSCCNLGTCAPGIGVEKKRGLAAHILVNQTQNEIFNLKGCGDAAILRDAFADAMAKSIYHDYRIRAQCVPSYCPRTIAYDSAARLRGRQLMWMLGGPRLTSVSCTDRHECCLGGASTVSGMAISRPSGGLRRGLRHETTQVNDAVIDEGNGHQRFAWRPASDVPGGRGRHAAESRSHLPVSVVAFIAATGVLLVAAAYTFGRHGYADSAWAVRAYWLGQALIVMPAAARLLSRHVLTAGEIVVLITVLTIAEYLITVCYSPAAFTFSDELSHWRTTVNILQTGKLFTVTTSCQ